MKAEIWILTAYLIYTTQLSFESQDLTQKKKTEANIMEGQHSIQKVL